MNSYVRFMLDKTMRKSKANTVSYITEHFLWLKKNKLLKNMCNCTIIINTEWRDSIPKKWG